MAKREVVTAFVACAGAVAAVEAAAWGVLPRPISAHDDMSPSMRIFNVLIFGVPHAIAAFNPMISIGWYLPYATYFVSSQAVNWWLPYLLGIRGRESLTLMNSEGVRTSRKILPPLATRPAPSGEHTVLLGLSATALGLAAHIFMRQRPSVRNAIVLDHIPLAASGLMAALAAANIVREVVISAKVSRAQANGDVAAKDEMALDPLPFIQASTLGGVLYWMYK